MAESLAQPVGYEQETPCLNGWVTRHCGRQSVEQEHDVRLAARLAGDITTKAMPKGKNNYERFQATS